MSESELPVLPTDALILIMNYYKSLNKKLITYEQNEIVSLAISPCCKLIAVSVDYEGIKILDLNGNLIKYFGEKSKNMAFLDFSSNGKYIISAYYVPLFYHERNNITLWDINGNIIQTYNTGYKSIKSIKFICNSTKILYVEESAIKTINFNLSKDSIVYRGSKSCVDGLTNIDILPNTSFTIHACPSMNFAFFQNLCSPNISHGINLARTENINTTFVKYSCDGKYFVASFNNGSIKLYKLSDNSEPKFVKRMECFDKVIFVGFKPNCESIVSGTIKGVITEWSLDGTKIATNNLNNNAKSMTLSPDGNTIVVVGKYDAYKDFISLVSV
jgi:uncharacterized protein with WD repeat